MDIRHPTPDHTPASAAFIGRSTLLVRCAETFVRAGHAIRLIVSSEPLVRRWGDERGIRCVGDDECAALDEESFDYLFNVGSERVLPLAQLARAGCLALNFHDGPLPRYAGLHATSWALLHREAHHGVTWHEMTERVDAGRIAARRTFAVLPGDTALALNVRCYEAGVATFAELVGALTDGTLTLSPQDAGERTYFGAYRRPEAACALRWDRSAEDLAALAVALDFGTYRNPLGLPKVHLEDGAVVAREVRALGERSGAAAGTITRLDAGALHVATASADVALGGLATLDGRPLPPTDVAERFGLVVGHRLPLLDQATAARLSSLYEDLCRHESFWAERLGELAAPDVPYARRPAAGHQAIDSRASDQGIDARPARAVSVVVPLPADLAALRPSDMAAGLGDVAVALVAAHLGRLGDATSYTLGFSEPALRRALAGAEALFATRVPLRVRVDRDAPLSESLATVLAELARARCGRTYARDLVQRTPALRDRFAEGEPSFPVVVELVERTDAPYTPPEGCRLAILVAADGPASRWVYDPDWYADEDVAMMQRQLGTLARAAVARPDTPLRRLPLLDDDERQRMLVEWNDTACRYDSEATIHELIAARAARTPDRVALVHEDERLTYRELDAAANRIAHQLRSLGVGPESLVGVCLERSSGLVAALLGVMQAGGAYVPLDPSYPRERLGLMAEDAGLAALVTREALAGRFDDLACPRVLLDRDAALIGAQSPEPPTPDVSSEHAAYVIYTSGSTGRPKGVVVTHRNVASFFAGMDERIPRGAPHADEPPGTWLAVTSPSFDISVLELFWTLARGFTVVLGGGGHAAGPPAPPPRGVPEPPGVEGQAGRASLDFSLFYFASGGGATTSSAADAYRLLLEGARFADRHGFRAVWTPERHFHQFGGPFPNPSVAAAALATITERVQLRAGSCVLPLHSPIRVAEEWAFVDNLSGGRVGISFAAGWQPNDFVLAPASFAERTAVMHRDVDIVRRLWRGDAVPFPGPDGTPLPISTYPRPIQPELPTWITAASSPETFRLAGELGCGILTHLLGQRYEDVRAKLAIYREAWRAAGHPGRGHAVLMVHTFVADDPELVRATVREPLIGYLRDSVDLIEKAAWSFPAFAALAERTGLGASELFEGGRLGADELAALLEHAFERYFATSGLFGTPESCLETLGRITAADVDEVACLIDFGIPADTVLASLPHLVRLMELAKGSALTPSPPLPAAGEGEKRESVGVLLSPREGEGLEDVGSPTSDHRRVGGNTLPDLIVRHGVTHLQCTPSMAGMLVLDERAREALGSVRCLLVGGEVLPAPLAAELKRLVNGDVLNMYGPTETTIWSASYAVRGDETSVPIGRPIANTTLYVVDEEGEPVPPGLPGELLIGGPGVARGYLRRTELTAERFVRPPFSAELPASDGTGASLPDRMAHAADRAEDARLYRTGDRARYRRDGTVEFLGRLDDQVKLRGHRIELGEVEAALARHPSVREAAVVVREEGPGGAWLLGYVTPTNGAIDVDGLREWVGRALPAIMVPARVEVRDALPRTPNGKLDRRALVAGEDPRVALPAGPPALRSRGVLEPPGIGGQGGHREDRPLDAEATIADVWREVLGLQAVDLTASFFDLGGHSLLAAQAVYLLRARLGRELAITDLFRFPTVRALARHLESGDDGAGVRTSRERAEARRAILARRRLARQPLGR